MNALPIKREEVHGNRAATTLLAGEQIGVNLMVQKTTPICRGENLFHFVDLD